MSGVPKVNSFIHLSRKAAVVFIKVHKQPQFTCQADTVIDSIVDCHEFTGSQK